jgi:hypothetical protein
VIQKTQERAIVLSDIVRFEANQAITINAQLVNKPASAQVVWMPAPIRIAVISISQKRCQPGATAHNNEP